MPPLKERSLVLIIGPPGSGKSTMIHAHYYDHVVIDLDHMITAVYSTLKYYPHLVRIGKCLVNEAMSQALGAGLAIAMPIWGAVKKERYPIIQKARGYGYRVVLVRMIADKDVCIARCKMDATRPKTTKYEPIVSNYFRRFQPPEEDEYIEIKS